MTATGRLLLTKVLKISNAIFVASSIPRNTHNVTDVFRSQSSGHKDLGCNY